MSSIQTYVTNTTNLERESDKNICHLEDSSGIPLCLDKKARYSIDADAAIHFGIDPTSPQCFWGRNRCVKCAVIWVELKRWH